jgi:hypothetical protein
MSMPTSLILAGCIAWNLAACSSGQPLPALPDGLHRVPVNRVPPVPDASATVPAAPDVGDRS